MTSSKCIFFFIDSNCVDMPTVCWFTDFADSCSLDLSNHFTPSLPETILLCLSQVFISNMILITVLWRFTCEQEHADDDHKHSSHPPQCIPVLNRRQCMMKPFISTFGWWVPYSCVRSLLLASRSLAKSSSIRLLKVAQSCPQASLHFVHWLSGCH